MIIVGIILGYFLGVYIIANAILNELKNKVKAYQRHRDVCMNASQEIKEKLRSPLDIEERQKLEKELAAQQFAIVTFNTVIGENINLIRRIQNGKFSFGKK